MSETSSTQYVANARLHYLDAFRVGMLLLGIPFHASEVFRSGDWLVSSAEGSGFLVVANHLIHAFRMFAFFFISGFFSALLLKRSAAPAWLNKRAQGLTIPLVLSAFALAPLEAATIAHFRTSDMASFLSLWISLLTQDGSIWLLHRWFLVVLIIHTAVIAAVAELVRRNPVFFGAAADRVATRAQMGYGLMLVGLALYGVVAAVPFQYMERDWAWALLPLDRALLYAAPFAVGGLVAVIPDGFDRFIKAGWIAAVPAAACLAIYAITAGIDAIVPKVISRLVFLPCGLFCTQFLMAAAKSLFSSANIVIEELIGAAFVIYLVHMVCVLAFSQLCIAYGLHPIMAANLTALLTLLTTFVFYRAIRHSDILGFTFNGGPFKHAGKHRPQASGQCVREDFRAVAPADGKHDELLAVDHVSHR
jgi:glucan biosynthesis protein C